MVNDQDLDSAYKILADGHQDPATYLRARAVVAESEHNYYRAEIFWNGVLAIEPDDENAKKNAEYNKNKQ